MALPQFLLPLGIADREITGRMLYRAEANQVSKSLFRCRHTHTHTHTKRANERDRERERERERETDSDA